MALDPLPFRPPLARALEATTPRPTLVKLKVDGGLRLELLDPARKVLVLRLAHAEAATGEAGRSALTAVDVIEGEVGPAQAAWIAAVVSALPKLDADPAWPGFLARSRA